LVTLRLRKGVPISPDLKELKQFSFKSIAINLAGLINVKHTPYIYQGGTWRRVGRSDGELMVKLKEGTIQFGLLSQKKPSGLLSQKKPSGTLRLSGIPFPLAVKSDSLGFDKVIRIQQASSR